MSSVSVVAQASPTAIMQTCVFKFTVRRGLAFYHLGMQREAWNDLTVCMGGAPRHIRKKLGVSYALDMFRLKLNPKVPVPIRMLQNSCTRTSSSLPGMTVDDILMITSPHAGHNFIICEEASPHAPNVDPPQLTFCGLNERMCPFLLQIST